MNLTIKEVEKQVSEQRTLQQNKAIHVMFKQLADELNDHGMYISRVIKTEAPWNEHRVKELIWKPTQETLFNTNSTTELTTNQIDEVFTVIHKALAEKGIEIRFPSVEEMAWDERLSAVNDGKKNNS